MTTNAELREWAFQYFEDGKPWYVQEPDGEFFDVDAKGFLEFITARLNAYHKAAAAAGQLRRALREARACMAEVEDEPKPDTNVANFPIQRGMLLIDAAIAAYQKAQEGP